MKLNFCWATDTHKVAEAIDIAGPETLAQKSGFTEFLRMMFEVGHQVDYERMRLSSLQHKEEYINFIEYGAKKGWR